MMRQENLETTEDTENTETLCSLASHIPISSPLKANCQVLSAGLQILPRPLVDAVQSLLQVLQRIRDAEAQVAFAEFTEGGA
jgi:hypothetical protein